MAFVCVFSGHSVLSFLKLLEMLIYSVLVQFLFANFKYNIVNFITRKTETKILTVLITLTFGARGRVSEGIEQGRGWLLDRRKVEEGRRSGATEGGELVFSVFQVNTITAHCCQLSALRHEHDEEHNQCAAAQSKRKARFSVSL